jgi:hypothetical protein
MNGVLYVMSSIELIEPEQNEKKNVLFMIYIQWWWWFCCVWPKRKMIRFDEIDILNKFILKKKTIDFDTFWHIITIHQNKRSELNWLDLFCCSSRNIIFKKNNLYKNDFLWLAPLWKLLENWRKIRHVESRGHFEVLRKIPMRVCF